MIWWEETDTVEAKKIPDCYRSVFISICGFGGFTVSRRTEAMKDVQWTAVARLARFWNALLNHPHPDASWVSFHHRSAVSVSAIRLQCWSSHRGRNGHGGNGRSDWNRVLGPNGSRHRRIARHAGPRVMKRHKRFRENEKGIKI
jgi:hypothetical protein